MKKRTNTRLAYLVAMCLPMLMCMMVAGCDVVNPLQCIPCGDFIIDCDTQDLGCPVCYSFDVSTLETKMCYQDGSCTVGDGAGGIAFYDENGDVCYKMSVDAATQSVTFNLNDKEYTVKDEVWTCPDGSTWTWPEACEGEETTVPDSDSGGVDPTCPSIFGLPACDEHPAV